MASERLVKEKEQLTKSAATRCMMMMPNLNKTQIICLLTIG
jgi:hypothetical protein